MDLSGPIGEFISAAIVACLGTWWFAHVLGGLKSLSSTGRNVVFASIWGAYFTLMVILIRVMTANGVS